MSFILDALQRAESDRTGATTPSTKGAPELIRRVESIARGLQDQETLNAASIVPSAIPDERSISEAEPQHAFPSGSRTASTEKLRQAFPTDFPTLHLPQPIAHELICIADKEHPAAEAFRLLGVRLRHYRRDFAFKKVMIASTVPQEGKSLISANLACTLATASPLKVLLIEGDVRRASISSLLRLDAHPGLCEYLQGKQKLHACIYGLEEAGIWFMPAGNNHANPLELLQSASLSTMFHEVGNIFDWIIIDSPPVLPLADASIWARLADRILLVARHGVTQKHKLTKGIEALDSEKLLGAIMNSSTSSTDEDYYYYRRPSDQADSSDIS